MSRETLLILFTSIALYPFIAAAEKETTSLDAMVVEGESTPWSGESWSIKRKEKDTNILPEQQQF